MNGPLLVVVCAISDGRYASGDGISDDRLEYAH